MIFSFKRNTGKYVYFLPFVSVHHPAEQRVLNAAAYCIYYGWDGMDA